MNNFTIKIENCRRELRQLQNENEKLSSKLRADEGHCSELETQVRRAREERLALATSSRMMAGNSKSEYWSGGNMCNDYREVQLH